MFHRFHPAGGPPSGQGSLTEQEFEDILHLVGVSNILTPEEWIGRLREGGLRSRDLCITFDDGLRSQYLVALPVLRKYRLKAFWFIYSAVFEGQLDRNEIQNLFAVRHFSSFAEYVAEFLAACAPAVRRGLEGPEYRQFANELKTRAPFYADDDLAYRFVRNRLMSRAEFEHAVDRMIEAKGLAVDELGRALWMDNSHLQALCAAGHAIGLHSYHHPFDMVRLSASEQMDEFARNRAHISKVTGAPVRSMSHPLNSYDDTTLEVLAALGIECGFRANMVAPAGKRLNPGALELAREDAVSLRNRGLQ